MANENCQWEPLKQITWLGYDWDLATECVKVTQGRLDSLLGSLNVILNNYEQGVHYLHVKDIASVAGKVISMDAGVGQVCRLKTRTMYECIFIQVKLEREGIGDKGRHRGSKVLVKQCCTLKWEDAYS